MEELKKVDIMDIATEMKLFTTDLISRQSNDFIESHHVQEYTIQELKIIEFIISQTTKKDIELVNNRQNKLIKITVMNFCKMINASPSQIYRDTNKIADNLLSKKMDFKYKDKKGQPAFQKKNFFSGVTYENGEITFEINNFVLPYFIEVKERYTEINLKYLIAIDSSYGIKLYKLLKQYSRIGKREFLIDDLKRLFGISSDQYKLYANFKKALTTAIRHINQSTDINVEFSEIKEKRTVKTLVFLIKNK